MSWQQLVNRQLRSIAGVEIRRVGPAGAPRNRLPDFIIIGAQKAGTTSLFHYLAQHPHLVRSRRKEVHFFDDGLNPKVERYAWGPSWYARQFPAKPLGGKHRSFEASPFYLYHPLAPERIASLLPDVKLIAVLRDPVERAISHYFHVSRRGRETLPMLAAMQAEDERLAASLERRKFNSTAMKSHSYKSRGIYHEQLRRYYQHFPARNVLVLPSERLFAKPEDTLREIFSFVGVRDDHTVQNLKARNVSGNRAPVDAEVRGYLTEYFRPHNERLYELLDEDYGWAR